MYIPRLKLMPLWRLSMYNAHKLNTFSCLGCFLSIRPLKDVFIIYYYVMLNSAKLLVFVLGTKKASESLTYLSSHSSISSVYTSCVEF